MDTLQWLMDWYAAECNGGWEHIYGIKIDTLDNPGWLVLIDIYETDMYDRPFEEVNIYNGDNDWIMCGLKENGTVFEGAGDPAKLGEIINVFREWVGSTKE